MDVVQMYCLIIMVSACTGVTGYVLRDHSSASTSPDGYPSRQGHEEYRVHPHHFERSSNPKRVEFPITTISSSTSSDNASTLTNSKKPSAKSNDLTVASLETTTAANDESNYPLSRVTTDIYQRYVFDMLSAITKASPSMSSWHRIKNEKGAFRQKSTTDHFLGVNEFFKTMATSTLVPFGESPKSTKVFRSTSDERSTTGDFTTTDDVQTTTLLTLDTEQSTHLTTDLTRDTTTAGVDVTATSLYVTTVEEMESTDNGDTTTTINTPPSRLSLDSLSSNFLGETTTILSNTAMATTFRNPTSTAPPTYIYVGIDKTTLPERGSTTVSVDATLSISRFTTSPSEHLATSTDSKSTMFTQSSQSMNTEVGNDSSSVSSTSSDSEGQVAYAHRVALVDILLKHFVSRKRNINIADHTKRIMRPKQKDVKAKLKSPGFV